MSEDFAPRPLLDAVERYFMLMYEADVSRFFEVFAPSAQLHGFRDGMLRILNAQDYRNMLAAKRVTEITQRSTPGTGAAGRFRIADTGPGEGSGSG